MLKGGKAATNQLPWFLPDLSKKFWPKTLKCQKSGWMMGGMMGINVSISNMMVLLQTRQTEKKIVKLKLLN